MAKTATIIKSKSGLSKIGVGQNKGYGELDLPESDVPASSPYNRGPEGVKYSMAEGEKLSQKMATDFPQSTPNVPRETLKNIPASQAGQGFDYLPKEDEPSIQDQLAAMQIAHNRLVQAQPELANQPNYDQEPHGFDDADKLGIHGALAVGGVTGLAEFGARTVQILKNAGDYLREGMPRKFGEAMPKGIGGTAKEFTDWFNRAESRNKLLQDAKHFHPIATEIGKLVGSALPLAMIPGMGVAKAAEGVAGAAEVVGAAEAMTDGLIVKAINNGAAKSIINAKKVGRAVQISKLMGQGAMINETNYDPENNFHLSQDVAMGALNLVFHGAANLVKAGAKSSATAIKGFADKYGIDLPIYPTLEKIAKHIPWSGYDKMIKRRIAQIAGAAERIKKEINTEAKGAFLVDLDNREIELNKALNDPTLGDHASSKIRKQIGELQNQRNLLTSENEKNVTMGHRRYLKGKLNETLREKENKVSELNNQIDKDMENAPSVDISTTRNLAQSIIKDQDALLPALRMPKLTNIAENLLGSDSELKAKFASVGITEAEDVARILNEVFTGNKITDPKMYSLVSPILGDVSAILKSDGLLAQPKDLTDFAYQFMSDKPMPYRQFRENLKKVGARLKQKGKGDSSDQGNLKRLYGAMSKDTEVHLDKYGNENTKNLYKEQARIYHDEVRPYYQEPFNEFREDMHNADKFIGAFFKPDQPELASQIIKMTAAHGGKQSLLAARAAVMNEAFERAMTPGAGINPVKFMNELNDLSYINNVFFDKEQNATFNGYMKLINTVKEMSKESLGQDGVVSAGKELVHSTHDLLRKIGLIGAVVTGGASHGVIGSVLLPLSLAAVPFGRMVTSPKGRKLMMKFANMSEKETSENLDSVLTGFLKISFPKAVALQAGAKAIKEVSGGK